MSNSCICYFSSHVFLLVMLLCEICLYRLKCIKSVQMYFQHVLLLIVKHFLIRSHKSLLN